MTSSAHRATGRALHVVLVVVLLAAGLATLLSLVIWPAACSPRSRLFASELGYPAWMRRLDRPIEVPVRAVERREVTRRLAAAGSLAYLEEISVRSEVLGLVTEVLVEPGDRVARGAVLARLETGGYSMRVGALEVDLRRVELESARVRLERALRLTDDELGVTLVSEDSLQALQDAVSRAEIAMRVAEEERENSLRTRSQVALGAAPDPAGADQAGATVGVLAARAGTVLEVRARPGENLVRPEQVLCVLGDRLVFRADFDQRHAGEIQVGDEVLVRLRARPGAPFSGRVLRIGLRVADDAEPPRGGVTLDLPAAPRPAHTFRAWIALDEDARPLLAGMDGYALLERRFEAPCVPEGALMRFTGREATVLALDEDDRVRVARVTYEAVGEDGWVALESGLRVGERVIVEGQLAMRPGDRVAARHDD